MKYLQPVEVYWVDSHNFSDWEIVSVKKKKVTKASLLVRTVGMLVKKNKNRVIVAQSIAINKEGEVWNMADVIVIPASAVKRIKKL